MTGPSELSNSQRQGAVLIAAGYKPAAVARVLDVEQSTVKSWMKKPDFQVAEAEFAERASKEIEPLIERVKVELVDASSTAIATLVALTEATNKDGSPANSIRASAAASILTHLRLVTGTVGNANSGDSPQTAVVVVQAPTQAEAKKIENTIEGQATEQ